MDINENFEDYYRRPTFPELFVTKLVVTQGTTRYQMKDMDIIFLLIPIGLGAIDLVCTQHRGEGGLPKCVHST